MSDHRRPFKCLRCGCRAYLTGAIPSCRVCGAVVDASFCPACIGPDTRDNQAHRRAVLEAIDEGRWANQYTRRIA